MALETIAGAARTARFSVKAKVTLVATLLFLLTLAAISAVHLAYVKQELKAVLARQQHAVVSRVADDIDEKLRTHRDLIEGRAKTVPPELLGDPARLQAWLGERFGLRAVFTDLFIISARGAVLADAPAQGRQGLDVSDREYLHATVQSRQAYISRPYLGRGNRQPVIAFTAPVLDAQGEVAAVLMGSLNLLQQNFLGRLAEAKVGESGSFAVFTRERTIVISRDKSRIMTQGPAPGISPYFDRATAGQEGSEEAVNSRGLHAIFSYTSLDSAPWVVVASLPVEEAYLPIQTTQNRIVQVTLLFGLLVAPLIWLAVRRFYDPVRRALGEQELGLQRAQGVAKLAHVISAPDGSFESWSDTLPRMLGLANAAMPRSTREWLEYVHPEDREHLRTVAIEAGKSGRRLQFEYRLKSGSGTWIRIRQVSEPLDSRPGAGGRGRWIGTLQDVTERERVAQELRESQKRLDGIVESAMDAIVTVDAGLKVVLVNRAAERMFGYAAAELLGQPLEVLLPERYRAGHAAHLEAFARSGVTSRSMGALRPISGLRRNGEEFPIEASISKDDSSGRLFLTAILRDITESKRYGDALKASEARLKLFVEHAPAAIAMFDRDMRYLAVSRRWLADYRVQERVAGAVEGRSHYEVFPDLPEHWKEVHRRCLAGEVAKADEDPFPRADGRVDWVRWEIRPWRRADGEVGGIILFSELVTERREAAERIRRLNRVYAVLSGINALIVRVEDRGELLRDACRIAVEEGKFPLAWAGAVNRKEKRVELVASAGDARGYLEHMPLVMSLAGADAQGLVDMAVREGKAMVANDVATNPHILVKQEALARGFRAIVILPLASGGEVTGVLALYASEAGFFDEEEMKLLDELAGDVSFALEHIAKSEKLDYLAFHDTLTGLANRHLIEERLSEMVSAALRDETRAALILLDIERFKTINDTLGRHAGDALLKQIAERMRSASADERWIARLGADHFAVIVPDVASSEELIRRTEQRLRQVFGPPFRVDATELRVAAKLGIALVPEDGTDCDTLFRNAESALNKAKASGERYLFYTEQMTERVAEKLALEISLRQALERGEFVLHYQPKVDLESRRVVGVEALIRWRRAGELVPPAQFIPLMEETGLIREAGAWALRRAVLDHRHWLRMGIAAPRVAVNVSAFQLRQQDFVGALQEIVAQGANPTGLDLEITESLLMENLEGNIRKLQAVRELGVQIAIDDFGTGYSSLGYLAKLPVQTLKIDRSFIVNLLKDPTATTLVQTIITLAHSLRLKVVAEGVESEEQATMLRLLRCHEIQGYVVSKPLPFEEVTIFLREHGARPQ